MAKVVWSVAADNDLDLIYRFLRQVSPQYAARVVAALTHASRQLEAFPNSGRIVPDRRAGRRPGLRELIVGNYRLVYVVNEEEVRIMRILHGHQDLRRQTGPEGEPL